MKSIIKLVQKIRSSFTLQLTIWVGGGVLLISAVVIFLLAQFSQQVIRDESVEITQQALANMALRIDNELRQADISARLEHRTFTIDRLMIEKMIEENRRFMWRNRRRHARTALPYRKTSRTIRSGYSSAKAGSASLPFALSMTSTISILAYRYSS